MDSKRRKSAHNTYDRLRNAQQAQSAERPEAAGFPEPYASEPTRAQARATAEAFAGAGLSENVPPAGESKIDEELRRDRNRPVQLRKKIFPADVVFFMLVLGLLAFGLIMMYSASYAWSIYDYGTPNHYINQQLLGVAFGGAAIVFCIIFDYSTVLKKLTWPLFIVSLFLMVLVILIGKTANGAKRWLQLGPIGFQPSEIAKLAVIWALAWVYSKAGKRVRTFKWGILPLFLILGSMVALTLAQKHVSAIILMTLTAGVMAYLAGTKAWQLAGLACLGGGGIVAIVKFSDKFNYILARIAIWKDPFSDPSGLGYQTLQSLYAISSGGLFGLGLGQSRQKQLFLPEAQNDYVFSIVCEELGLVGAILLILLFAALVFRGYWIAVHAADKFGAMLAAGITTMIALQTVMNIAVVTNTMPVTGISLPFFSYGGTSLAILLAEMGIILSVSKQMRT